MPKANSKNNRQVAAGKDRSTESNADAYESLNPSMEDIEMENIENTENTDLADGVSDDAKGASALEPSSREWEISYALDDIANSPELRSDPKQWSETFMNAMQNVALDARASKVTEDSRGNLMIEFGSLANLSPTQKRLADSFAGGKGKNGVLSVMSEGANDKVMIRVLRPQAVKPEDRKRYADALQKLYANAIPNEENNGKEMAARKRKVYKKSLYKSKKGSLNKDSIGIVGFSFGITGGMAAFLAVVAAGAAPISFPALGAAAGVMLVSVGAAYLAGTVASAVKGAWRRRQMNRQRKQHQKGLQPKDVSQGLQDSLKQEMDAAKDRGENVKLDVSRQLVSSIDGSAPEDKNPELLQPHTLEQQDKHSERSNKQTKSSDKSSSKSDKGGKSSSLRGRSAESGSGDRQRSNAKEGNDDTSRPRSQSAPVSRSASRRSVSSGQKGGKDMNGVQIPKGDLGSLDGLRGVKDDASSKGISAPKAGRGGQRRSSSKQQGI